MKKKILSVLAIIAFVFTIGAPVLVSAAPADALNRCIISPSSAQRLSEMGVECGYTTTDGGSGVSGVPTEKVACPYGNGEGNCGACCLLNAVFNLTDWVFIGLMTISALMIIYGAYCFIIAGANPDKAKQGRQLLMYAAIGIAVAFFSRALPTLVRMLMGV